MILTTCRTYVHTFTSTLIHIYKVLHVKWLYDDTLSVKNLLTCSAFDRERSGQLSFEQVGVPLHAPINRGMSFCFLHGQKVKSKLNQKTYSQIRGLNSEVCAPHSSQSSCRLSFTLKHWHTLLCYQLWYLFGRLRQCVYNFYNLAYARCTIDNIMQLLLWRRHRV